MSGSNSSGREPLAPIVLTVHSVAPPDLADATDAARRRTAVGRLKMLAVLAVCAAPVIASYVAYYVVRPDARSNYGQLVQPSRSLPELELTDLEGRRVPSRSLLGQWLLVAVGPAGCDAACEKRLFAQRQLREMLGRERDRLDKVWLVTDRAPLRETLRAALTAAPATTVLRADGAAISAWLAPENGHAIEDHLYVVDPMGEWMMRMPVDADPAKVKRDLERLLRASAGWDQPGR